MTEQPLERLAASKPGTVAKPITLAARLRLVGWVLMLVLGLFPVLAATADLASDVRGELPADHQATFVALAGESWVSARQTAPGPAGYITVLETGYAVHELVFGLLLTQWPWLFSVDRQRCRLSDGAAPANPPGGRRRQ